MPKYSLTTIVRKAISPAVQDRDSMLQADPDRAEEIRAEIAAIELLAEVDFSKPVTPAQRMAAFAALMYAEQWEMGLADSLGNRDAYGREAAKDATMFLKYRHLYFGKSKLETMMDASEVYSMGGDGKFRNKDGKLMPTRTL